MDLKEFIKATLLDIINGVKEAQNEVKGTGAIINPSTMFGGKDGKFLRGDGYRLATDIEINVALTVEEKAGQKAGLAVAAAIFGVGASSDKQETNNNVSVIKFTIPVALPTMDIPAR